MSQLAGSVNKQGSAVACSAGVVVACVQKLDLKHQFIPEYKISEDDVAAELKRLSQAVEQASATLKREIELLEIHHQTGDLGSILETHRMMLQDPELIAATERLVQGELLNVEWALKKSLHRIARVFDGMQDAYLRSRKIDIEHVGERIFTSLAGRTEMTHQASQSIMVAMDFTPSEVVSMWRAGVPGFISVQGGENSHAMIVARGIGLPGLAGVNKLYNLVEDGDQLILDAEKGLWLLKPDENELKNYSQFQEQLTEQEHHLQHYVNQPSKSKDGYEMPLMANIEFVEEVEVANSFGVDGIGLFRTEFLFMQAGMLPCENTQYEYYAQVVKGMKGKPVTFRLLDVGADKLVHAEALLGIYDGENPALGLRGVRMLLHKPEVLKAQLKAIVRAALLAEVSVLVPMVTLADEMKQVRDMLELVKKELGVNKKIPLGCMIEVPAAVFIAKELAEVSDFFSIGSNDLVQYSLAVDRADELVSYLYDSGHPAIMTLIQMTIDAALQQGIPVTLCGELAAKPKWTQALLNLRITSLSMSARKVLPIRECLHHLEAFS